jgi:hypothetical protein
VQRNVAGSKLAKSLSDVRPQATAGSLLDSGAPAGSADVLAGKPGSHQVHRGHGGPVDPGQVSQVGDAGEPRRQDSAGMPVGLGAPGQGRSQHRCDGQVQAAETGAHAPGPQPRDAIAGGQAMAGAGHAARVPGTAGASRADLPGPA